RGEGERGGVHFGGTERPGGGGGLVVRPRRACQAGEAVGMLDPPSLNVTGCGYDARTTIRRRRPSHGSGHLLLDLLTARTDLDFVPETQACFLQLRDAGRQVLNFEGE